MQSTFNVGPRQIRFAISNFGTRRIYVDECLVDRKWKLLPYGIQVCQIDGKTLRFELPSKDTGKNSVYYDGMLVVEELLPDLVVLANSTTTKIEAFNSKFGRVALGLTAMAALLFIYNSVA